MRNDYFFNHVPTKKQRKAQNLNPEIHGHYYGGRRWAKRTGAYTIRRLNKACKKYLGKSLFMTQDPGQ